MHHDLKILFPWNLWSLRTLKVIKNNLTAIYFKFLQYVLRSRKQTVCRVFLKWFHHVVKILGSFSILVPKTWLIKSLSSANCQPSYCPFIADYFMCKLSLIPLVGLWLLRIRGDECATKKKRKTSKFTLESSTYGISHSSHGLSSDN